MSMARVMYCLGMVVWPNGCNFMFAYSKNLPSNINGGLGYWCGYGADTKSIIIGRGGE